MSLTIFNTANTVSAVFSTSSVAGLQVTSLQLSASAASTEQGFDPANGATTLFGVHDSETITGTVSGRMLANGLAGTTVGANVAATLTPAMTNLAGYVANNATIVVTGVSTSAAPGQFKTLQITFTRLNQIP